MVKRHKQIVKKKKSTLRKAFEWGEYLLPLAEAIIAGIMRRAPLYKSITQLVEEERAVIEANLPVAKMILRTVDVFTNTAGQALKGTFTMDPSASTDWAALAALYDEFRVRAIRVRFNPGYQLADQPSAKNSFPPLYVAYNDRTLPTPTVSAVLNYQNMAVIGPPHCYGSSAIYEAVRPVSSDATAIAWYACSSPGSSPGGIFFASTPAFTNSYSQIECVTEFHIEFRIRA